MVLISALFLLIRSLIVSRTTLAAENFALRHQLAVVRIENAILVIIVLEG